MGGKGTHIEKDAQVSDDVYAAAGELKVRWNGLRTGLLLHGDTPVTELTILPEWLVDHSLAVAQLALGALRPHPPKLIMNAPTAYSTIRGRYYLRADTVALYEHAQQKKRPPKSCCMRPYIAPLTPSGSPGGKTSVDPATGCRTLTLQPTTGDLNGSSRKRLLTSAPY
jgi:hypothetical protein